MAYAKKSVASALMSVFASASLLLFSMASFAATPIAVWDRDFTTMTQGAYTLSENGNTNGGDYLQISGDNGILFTSTDALNVFTVIVRCEGLNLSSSSAQVLFTSYGAENGPHDNKTGVNLPANNAECRGIWQGADWNSDAATQRSVPGNYKTLVYNHQQTNGTYSYALSPTSAEDETIFLTTLYSVVGLRSSGTTYKGFAIGGLRGTTSQSLLPATGLKITSLAVFAGTLSEAEMKSYSFPSETQTIFVLTDTSVSAINARLDSTYSAAAVSVADGVTITVDAAFSAKILSVSSEGSITLSAAQQPDASYYSGVNFSGVQGGLLRSWLTPGVVGFNFRSANGNDVSGALATADFWVHDNNSASGTSTAMFNDGLSTLTWASANTWSCAGSTIISGYLDDGALNGKGAEVKLSNVPYEIYDVIIYCSSDSNPGTFLPKTVNGKTYRWDTERGKTVEGDSEWGKAALSIPVYGVNALRIKNLTGPLTIYGTPRNGSQRGGIAAIEIMPPDTPDNIRTYTLTLSGATTSWSTGTWTLEGNTVDAPSSGYVQIIANASTALTIDQALSLADIKISAGDDIVVNVATNGTGSIYALKTTVESGVLQQGSPAVFGTSPTIVVDPGATFDLNGLAVNSVTSITLEGEGAGDWPWALTSSSGDDGFVKALTLLGDATVGGTNKISIGASSVGNDSYLKNNTLTKIGAGELYCTNLRFQGGGTLDIQEGTASFNQWTNLDGYETVDRHTAVTVRNGATLKNNAGRRMWIDTLSVEAGAVVTTTASGSFGVSAVFNGTCETTALEFDSGAATSLSGDLTTTTMKCGSLSLAKADGVASVVVTPGTLTASGAIAVGAGVTLNLGTSRPEAVFTVDPNAEISVQKTNASDMPLINVSAQPANIVLYDENGDAVADPIVVYDATRGTIALGTGYIWTGASGTWTSSQFDGKPGSTEGLGVTFSQGATPQSEVTVTVNGVKSVSSASFVATETAYTLTGDAIAASGGISINGAAPVTFMNGIEGAVAIGANSELTLAGETAVLEAGALTGSGKLVVDPGNGISYTMSAANTNFTGEAVVKSGTVKMGDAASFGPTGRASSIRVKGGASLDANGTISHTYQSEKNKVILEEGATFCASVPQTDAKLSAFTHLTLEGDATVDAPAGTVSISQHYNYDYTFIDLDTNTLTKTGDYDFFVSAVTISGSGVIDVKKGSITISSSYFNTRPSIMADGTLKVAPGAYLKMVDYTGNKAGGGVLTVKNLELNGQVTRGSANYSTLTVTGYVTGNGTTPMLTLGENAVLKPYAGRGFLTITESLTLPNDTLAIDLTDVDFASRTSVPLFKVGSAAMLPETSALEFIGTIPDGWELSKTADGLGYRLKKPIGLAIKLL